MTKPTISQGALGTLVSLGRASAFALALTPTLVAAAPLLLAAQPGAFECLIEPAQVVEIRSAVEGLIEKVHVQRGDAVRKGQVLVELESNAERSAAELARYRSQMQGRLAASRDRLEFATRKFERSRELAAQQYVAVQQRDEAEAEKRLAESELRDATENVALAHLEYRHATDLLNLRTLRSPFNGVVMERMLNPGDLAEAGTGRKPILRLAQIDVLRVEVVLPVEAFGKVAAGQTAEIRAEGVGTRHLATLKIVDRVFDAASGTFGVRLELPNPGLLIPSGLRCVAEMKELRGLEARSSKRY